MANIYNTPITVYRGTDYNPDGTSVPWVFCTAFLDEDDGYSGEFLFAVDENDNSIYPVAPVWSKEGVLTTKTYKNYCELLIAEPNV